MEEPTYNSERFSFPYGSMQSVTSSPGSPSPQKLQAVYTRNALYPDRLELVRIKSGYYLKAEELIMLLYPELHNLKQQLERSCNEQQIERTPPRPLSPVSWSQKDEGAEEASMYAVNEDNSWSTVSLSPPEEEEKPAQKGDCANASMSEDREQSTHKASGSPVKSLLDDNWLRELNTVFPCDGIN